MIRGLTGFMAAEAERRLKDFLLGVAAVSLGFGTFAAYIYLRALEGRVVAALIVCAACALLAITIGVIRAAPQRSGRLRPGSQHHVETSIRFSSIWLRPVHAGNPRQNGDKPAFGPAGDVARSSVQGAITRPSSRETER